MDKKDLWQRAMQIARNADVSTACNCAVVYSVHFLPTDENKLKALAYADTNPQMMMIDHTDCGKKLISLQLEKYLKFLFLDLLNELIRTGFFEIFVASKRYIAAASGNITAFVDGADYRSVFITTELPEILRNPKIYTINGIQKEKFRI